MKPCPICGGKLSLAFVKHDYHLARCHRCGLYHTALRQSYGKLTKDYYTKAYFTGSKNRAGYSNYADDHHIVRRNASRYLKIISKLIPRGRLLDVGCATGIFLQEANSLGYQVYGLDVSRFAITQAQKFFGTNIKLGPLTDRRFNHNFFDIITFFDVFEHLDKPRQVLQTVFRLLKPGGITVINTGDTSSLLAKIQGKNWHFFIPPQHIYFYSKTNLKRLLRSEKLQPIYANDQGKFLSLRYFLHLARTINHSSIADWLYRQVHRSFLGKIPLYFNLFDNMTIVAKKSKL